MSDNVVFTELTEIVVNKEDIENLENLYTHFRIQMPSDLKEQIEIFNSDPSNYSVAAQNDLRVALCKCLISSNHELFTDELFNEVIENAEKIVFNADFKNDLEEVLSENSEPGKE